VEEVAEEAASLLRIVVEDDVAAVEPPPPASASPRPGAVRLHRRGLGGREGAGGGKGRRWRREVGSCGDGTGRWEATAAIGVGQLWRRRLPVPRNPLEEVH
jgi:hypothetical protein